MTIVDSGIRDSAPELYYENDRDFWRASALSIGGVVLLVPILVILQVITDDYPPLMRLIISSIVSVIPPFLFLSDIQIRKRRHEKNYASLLIVLFILGALMAVAVTRPFLFQFIKLHEWLGITNAQNRLLSNILINAAWHSFLIFGVIRFGVWNSHLFKRKTDGLVFAYTSAWGYSAAYCLLLTLDYGALTVINGNFRLLTLHCNLISIATIIGYTMGKHKFERTPFFFLPLAMMIALIIGGLLLYACVELNTTSLSVDSSGYSPWPGIVVGVMAELALIYAAAGLIRREAKVIENRTGRTSV